MAELCFIIPKICTVIHLEILPNTLCSMPVCFIHFKHPYICWIILPNWEQIACEPGPVAHLFLFSAQLRVLIESLLSLDWRTKLDLKYSIGYGYLWSLGKIAGQLFICQWHIHIAFSDHSLKVVILLIFYIFLSFPSTKSLKSVFKVADE